MCDLRLVVARDDVGIELIEDLAVALALAQDRVPAQAGLRALQDEELEDGAVVVQRDAPLLVVVAHGQLVARPPTAYRFVRFLHVIPRFWLGA